MRFQKPGLLFFSLLSSLCLQAQTIDFERIIPPPPNPQFIADFDWLFDPAISAADIDGDGDEDLIITGEQDLYRNSAAYRIAKLYKNDGLGRFSEIKGTPFEGVSESTVEFGDIDADGDIDLLITGINNAGSHIAKLYKQDSLGDYVESTNLPFVGVGFGSTAFGDIDGDADLDLLITGRSKSFSQTNLPITKLYKNDGLGNFSEVTGTGLEKVDLSSVAFADVDGDLDLDLLITGQNISNLVVAKLYINDGIGNFSEVQGTPFNGVYLASVAFADIDGDLDQDLMISGSQGFGQPSVSKLYQNDGTGSFMEIQSNTFVPVRHAAVSFSDIDTDGDQDLLITGEKTHMPVGPASTLYKNDGNGNFSEFLGTTLEPVHSAATQFFDIDGDSDQDLVIFGRASNFRGVYNLYQNNGSGKFNSTILSHFEDIAYSKSIFADFDGDKNLDILLSGVNRMGDGITKIYANDGTGLYSDAGVVLFNQLAPFNVHVEEINGDAKPDIILIDVRSNNQRLTKVYQNIGQNSFSFFELPNMPFKNFFSSAIASEDVDGDGDRDILIAGRYGSTSAYQNATKLYKNDGGGSFSEVLGNSFEKVWQASVEFADTDNDGDKDILISGVNETSDIITKLYTNDGSGFYTEVPGTPFQKVFNASIGFADVEGDGDQDLLISGQSYSASSQPFYTKLYINNGAGVYAEKLGTPFLALEYSSIAFGDVDNDMDLDLLLTGNTLGDSVIAHLYQNDGNGNFQKVSGLPFEGVKRSSVGLADINNDTDLDILITGEDSTKQPSTKLYRNLLTAIGIKEINSELNVDVFPNPTTENVKVKFGNTVNKVNLMVLDIMGGQISSQKVNMLNPWEITEVPLPKAMGIYFLIIETEEEKSTFPIIKR